MICVLPLSWTTHQKYGVVTTTGRLMLCSVLAQIRQNETIEDQCDFLFDFPIYETPRNYWITSITNKCPNFHSSELTDRPTFIFNEAARFTAKS